MISCIHALCCHVDFLQKFPVHTDEGHISIANGHAPTVDGYVTSVHDHVHPAEGEFGVSRPNSKIMGSVPAPATIRAEAGRAIILCNTAP